MTRPKPPSDRTRLRRIKAALAEVCAEVDEYRENFGSDDDEPDKAHPRLVVSIRVLGEGERAALAANPRAVVTVEVV